MSDPVELDITISVKNAKDQTATYSAEYHPKHAHNPQQALDEIVGEISAVGKSRMRKVSSED